MQLRKYQQKGIDFLTSRKHSLLADDMGLGKTIQAIGAINKLNARFILIICPALVKLNWKRELEIWLCDKKLTIQIIASGKDNINKHRPNIVIVNYDLLLKSHIFEQLKKQNYSIMICDEAHYLKSIKSKRTKKVLGQKGIAQKCVYKMMLTGTPVLNKPIELYPMLKTLAAIPSGLADYTSFAKYFNGAYEDSMGYLKLGNPSNLDELHNLLSSFMIRRRIEDVDEELPDVSYQVIEIPMNEKIKDIVEKERKSQTIDGIDELGNMAKVRQEIALAKLKDCLQHIKNVLLEKNKIVIFAYHRAVIEILRQELSGYGVRILWGAMTPEMKQTSIHDFRNRVDIRIFVGQIQAAGQGIDGLQDVCDTIIFAEISWVPGEIAQAVGRLRRIGQNSKKVFVHILVAENTIEVDMMQSVFNKNKVIKQIVEEK